MKKNRLYVLYKLGLKDIRQDSIILSFMNPEDEQIFSCKCHSFLSGRKEIDSIREKARKEYIDLIAKIGATPCCNGKTLRQFLEIKGRGNPWWYNKISEKDSEGDDTFNMLLQIFTILDIAEREHIDEIVIYRSPPTIVRVLETRYRIKKISCNRALNIHPFIIGLLSRLKYLGYFLYCYVAVKRYICLPGIKLDVVFQGFWDWTVQIDQKDKKIKDDYFKLLPECLTKHGMRCAWFLWFDPYFKPGSRHRALTEVLSPSSEHPQLIFVQKFITLGDIVSIIFDFRYPIRYLYYSRLKEFRRVFKKNGCDFWSLFERSLLRYFCNSSIPHYFIMETAYRKAFDFYKPKFSFALFELFLASRAFYQGGKLGSPCTVKCSMQHASYGREKLFIVTDPVLELQGKPDNLPMPSPDYFFVMGELCKEILIENGVPSEKIFVTGSARYDNINVGNRIFNKDKELDLIKVLLVCTLSLKLDLELLLATFLASQNLNIKLYLRSHPYNRIENSPLYKRFKHYIIPSEYKYLDDDLANTDLVLFTYSTVAEQAFLKGIPIVQWQSIGSDGSVFRDISIIPRVYSVGDLRKTLETFLANSISFKPARENQELILRKCFYKVDGKAAYRIAEKISENLQ